MTPASTAFNLTESQKTGKTLFYGQAATEYTLKITRANCIPRIASTSGTYGDVTITYTLENDRASNCAIAPQYSADGGSTWTMMSEGTGGDGFDDLSTSAGGATHTFVWRTYTNLGNDYVGDILVKVRAYDQTKKSGAYRGDYADSQQLTLAVDNAPSAPTLVTPSDGYFQKDNTVQFIVTIPSNNNPTTTAYTDLHAKIECDIDSGFDSSNLVVFESRLDQSGWEYAATSGTWLAIPDTGIPITSSLVGNQVRYTVDQEDALARTTLYWRCSFGAVV